MSQARFRFTVVSVGTIVAAVGLLMLIVSTTSSASTKSSLAEEQYEDGAGEEYTISIAGDDGVSFFGNIGAFEGGGGVEGTTPQEYTVRTSEFAGMVSANIQKDSRSEDLLRVEIVRSSDGEVVAEDETTEEFGSVSVSFIDGQ